MTSEDGRAGAPQINPYRGGYMIRVPVISELGPKQTIEISYKNVVAPAATGPTVFEGLSRGTRTGGGFGALGTTTSTIMVGDPADKLAISSELQTIFVQQVSEAITIATSKDGSPATTAAGVPVALMSSSETGMFDVKADGAFDGTVTSVTIPAGEASVDVYYKDSVVGTATVTATATLGETEQTVTQAITISMGATALNLSAMGTLFSDGMVEIMLETQDDAGNATASGTDVVVTLSSSSEMGSFMVDDNLLGEDMTVTVMAGETSPMGTLTYTDTTVGVATLTATAEGLAKDTVDVTVTDIIGDIAVTPMTEVKAPGEVTVTVIAKPGLTPASFTVGDIVVAPGITLIESAEGGTYTGMFTVVAEAHADGTYDVVVTIGTATETDPDAVTIDNTAPMITSDHDMAVSAQNGDTIMLTVTSVEFDLTVMGTGLQALDTMAESDELKFMESTDTPGTYTASHVISANNDADNDEYMISVTATDAAGNASTAVSITVSLQNGGMYELMVPKDFSLIHVPLKVGSVDGEAKTLDTIGNLYDALGGQEYVDFLITRDSENKRWDTFLRQDLSGGTRSDRKITAGLGILAKMKKENSLTLRGEAWGENGVSMISLKEGLNLVGVPLDSEELDMIGDLVNRQSVSWVTLVDDDGEFVAVIAAGGSGDGPIVGGRSYIVKATDDDMIEVTGEVWNMMPEAGPTAAPVAIPSIVAVDGVTPVLAVHGNITSELRGAAQAKLRITIKNLTTGETISVGSDDEGDAGEYGATFVDTKAARAAQVGDVFEIKASSPNPLVGVQPLRHIISVDDVKNSRIQLAELVTYEIPAKTELLLNYPNPFNPETWIPFRLSEDSQVSLTIYDRTGRVVRSVDVGHRPAAVYESRAKAIYWDGRNDFGERVASGMYFYTLTAKDFSATRRMVILK